MSLLSDHILFGCDLLLSDCLCVQLLMGYDACGLGVLSAWGRVYANGWGCQSHGPAVKLASLTGVLYGVCYLNDLKCGCS
jgi:uncharacterized membrane protein YeiH